MRVFTGFTRRRVANVRTPARRFIFEDKSKIMATPGGVPVQAKRGSLLFVRRGFIYILSVELAERATQRSTYQMTTEQEDTLLSVRLTELVKRLIFSNALPSKT